LDNHLERLSDSADYFDFMPSEEAVRDALSTFQKQIPIPVAKIRLLLSKLGEIKLEWGSLEGVKSSDLKIGLAPNAIDSKNRFLYHKSTNRQVYEDALKSRPECDDVILWNEKGEVTESCRSNLVVEIDGELVTPPVSSGLLAGTFRRYLIETGEIEEKTILVTDLKKASRLFVVNSVRKWMNATLI
jgi:para-aminobenzoate synthetase/4-amino-4-deoxychorismate lyase